MDLAIKLVQLATALVGLLTAVVMARANVHRRSGAKKKTRKR